MHAAVMQVGQYTFNITPPTTLQGLAVLGSPLAVAVKAGLADVSHSAVNVTIPRDPRVGNDVPIQITLADAYGNPITAPEPGQYSNSRLTIYGAMRATAWCSTVAVFCGLHAGLPCETCTVLSAV